MSSLSKLVFFGSALHQLTFSLSSSLPFAIGQVQDVGLIFLSAMSTRVVDSLAAKGEHRDSVLLTTTLLAMTISTFIVGALLIFVGKCVPGAAPQPLSQGGVLLMAAQRKSTHPVPRMGPTQ